MARVYSKYYSVIDMMPVTLVTAKQSIFVIIVKILMLCDREWVHIYVCVCVCVCVCMCTVFTI